jgi:hypothetical protein
MNIIGQSATPPTIQNQSGNLLSTNDSAVTLNKPLFGLGGSSANLTKTDSKAKVCLVFLSYNKKKFYQILR